MSDREKELRERLAAAQAKKSATALDEKMRLAELEIDVERAERAERDEAAIAEALATYGFGRFAVVETVCGIVILKRPDTVYFKRFQDQENFKTATLEALVRHCRVYPDASGLDCILAEQPGALTQMADRCAYLAGARRTELSGK